MRVAKLSLSVSVVAGAMAVVPALPAQAAAATCRGVPATIVGTSGSDVIHGTAGRDVIAGLGGSDTIDARGGDDLVCGGYGADHLDGGNGNDALYGGKDRLHVAQEDGTERVGDTLRGGPGNDRLRAGVDRRSARLVVPDTFSWAGSAHGVEIDLRTGIARGQGRDGFAGRMFRVVGSSAGDVIEGTARRDRIDAGPGSDVVRARGGADIIDVDGTTRGYGGDADRVSGGGGADRITARRGANRLSGGPGNDWIEDLGGATRRLIGGAGDDRIAGQINQGTEEQVFNGGRGFDTLALYDDRVNRDGAATTGTWDMATGEMTYAFDASDVAIALSVPHIDRAIFATAGTSWTVSGTDEADSVSVSGAAAGSFDGLAGDDTFRGSDGDDVFDGGAGDDHSLGMGDGDDTCVSVETIDGADCEHVT